MLTNEKRFYATLICGLIMACSFPSKSTYSKIDNLQNHFPTLLPLIFPNFPNVHQYQLTSAQLRDSLKKIGFTTLTSVVYHQAFQPELIVDGSIEFTLKSREVSSESNLSIFLHESVVYCFAKEKPVITDTACEQYIVKKINDSVYYKRNYDSIVTVVY